MTIVSGIHGIHTAVQGDLNLLADRKHFQPALAVPVHNFPAAFYTFVLLLCIALAYVGRPKFVQNLNFRESELSTLSKQTDVSENAKIVIDLQCTLLTCECQVAK